MAEENAKKVILIYILDVLREYSDEKHPLTQSDIIKKIYARYGMTSERKAISRNIDNLITFGYDIVKCPNGGYYIVNDISDSEMAYIVDNIFSTYAIPSNFSKDLIDKVCKETNVYSKSRFKYVHQIDNVNKTKNKQVFFNLDIINEAIDTSKKILFTYNELSEKGKLAPRKNGKVYEVSPYFMAMNKGRYYLICNYEPYEELSNYRIDLITNIQISDKNLKQLKEFEKYKNGIDIGKYISEHIYMFSGDSVRFKVRLYDEKVKNDIVDWFGESVSFLKNGSEIFASFVANENAGYYWCMQYLEKVELVEPIEIREKLIENVEKSLKNYKNR